MTNNQSGYISTPAFTIVELLVVIVVIGILASITIVSYSGVTSKATIASVQSDLTSASKQLKLYYVDHGTYPTSLDTNNCPLGSNPSPDTRYCLKASSGNTFTYSDTLTAANPQTFRLANTKGTTSYSITNNSSPTAATATTANPTVGSACPSGFIAVPGSGTYNTNDFCVMKYEAKQVGATTTPISQAAGTPWVSISQTAAIANSQNVVVNGSACGSSCHLITEAEWMTIAQNVLSVPGNWSGAAVGSGYIYSGHNDSAPASILVADTNDSNGYYGETNTGGNQRRTLTLTNGEVIWDLAGNVAEWTSATIVGGQPGLSGESAYAFKQWNNTSLLINNLPYSSQPISTGIASITGWSSTQGIGTLYSYMSDAVLRGLVRGGYWFNGSAGVLSLYLGTSPSSPDGVFGFRVSR